MNEPHLRETAALELVSPMTLPQQDAGIPPLSPEISIHPARDIKSWLELYAADGIIYFCVWAQLNRSVIRSVYRLHLSQTTSRSEKRIGNGALLCCKKQEVKER